VREKYYWLVAGGWFVLREKYCWLVADKPNEQAATLHLFVYGGNKEAIIKGNCSQKVTLQMTLCCCIN
jgi:hypothetical protein